MSFKVPFDSSPPSTPDKSRSLFSLSETPAGGPPSASNSFTPRGPPPSTVFGSSQMSSRSQFDSPGSLFTKSGNINPNDSIFGSSIASFDYPATRGKKVAPAKSFTPSLFSVTDDSQFGESTNIGPLNSFASSQMDEVAEGEETVPEEEEIDVGDATGGSNRLRFLDSQFGKPALPPSTSNALRKPIYSNPSNAKRPKLDEKWADRSPLFKTKLSPKKVSKMPSIVRNFASRSHIASVEEPSDVIINTEDEICRLYDEARKAEYQDVNFSATLADVCSNLTDIWETYVEREGLTRKSSAQVGPGDHAPNVIKASFLGSLLLQLHHPPLSSETPGGFHNPLGFAAPRSLVPTNPRASAPTPIPKVLLDWLNTNYPQTAELRALKEYEPNPTASSNFWEILNAAVLRGHLSEAASVLHASDFNYARSALEDGLPQTGYRGAQLQNIQKCINKALQILDSCPGTQHGDWDVKGAEWAMYRKRVLAAVADLEEFAEGGEQQDSEPPVAPNRFQAINFGLKPTAAKTEFSFAQSARMAESRVPWTIYQNLRSMYRIILGDAGAVMNRAQDWVEATISLTVWWDGEDDDESSAQGNGLGASTSIHFLRPRVSKLPSSSAEDAYLRRLDRAFSSATNAESDDGGFRINSLSSLEVGLASVFEGNVDGVLELLQTWSLCVASAVAEVASAGGWLGTATGDKPLTGLSANDLMVLSYGQDGKVPKSRVGKDDILSSYASGLFERGNIENGVRKGWELALEVLSRLDNQERMQKSVSELLDKLPLDTAEQMDRAVLLCSELGLEKEGRRVSERFGDLTVAKSDEYGLALICYARAHNRRKVKSVVDLLISYSLVQSRAYPAPADLDEQLHSLVREPKACLSAVATVDEEAAGILQFYFSGYATLRRFYETRDEAIGLQEGQRPRFKPLARQRAAAQALVAVITSAADSIYGGLYDPGRDSAVQVDGLLTLLGEVLPFVNQSTPTLSVSQQSAVLSAIEDLETVTSRVYAQCEECFRSTLIEYQSSKRAGADSTSNDSFILPPSPRALLKKSVSSLTASSTFSFIGSDMVESARNRSGSGSAVSSGVLVPRSGDDSRSAYHERGWDWRAGLPEDAKGEDIIRMLRLGLAKGLSFGALGSV